MSSSKNAEWAETSEQRFGYLKITRVSYPNDTHSFTAFYDGDESGKESRMMVTRYGEERLESEGFDEFCAGVLALNGVEAAHFYSSIALGCAVPRDLYSALAN